MQWVNNIQALIGVIASLVGGILWIWRWHVGKIKQKDIIIAEKDKVISNLTEIIKEIKRVK